MELSCGALKTLFIIAILLTITGNSLGAHVWRRRLPQYSAWRSSLDPTYLFRAKFYASPAPRLRWIAAGILILAALIIVALATVVIRAQSAGARGICGFSF